MDRTIIPNGRQPEHPEALRQFYQFCRLPNIKLVYVTGRHLSLVKHAIAKYHLPDPEYAITDVGTKIWRRLQTGWTEMLTWQDIIAKDWAGHSHAQLQQLLKDVSFLSLQEQSKQSAFKLSYYLPLKVEHKKVLTEVEHHLTESGVAASLVTSIDEPKQVGLLDILPLNATKLHAIEFLRQNLGYGLQETIFAGDSGNDLQVLGSPIRSVLVANAEPAIKREALQLAEKNGCLESLYLARQDNSPLGGNYTAGVVQGVMFFIPEIEKELKLS
ncbi:MAG: HAD superfamily hydrolase (TIGR01484 family) [Desulforhopalus sp.]|jgi:HAD superfamily hydrolase (TIGR01484 family)